MLRRLRAAWQAGRAGQPMPAQVDRSTGQTGAIIGIAGVSIMVVFAVAYGFGRVERSAREAELSSGDSLKELEEDAEAAKLELSGEVAVTEKDLEEVDVPEVEEEELFPPGSAACPVCNTVHLDSDHAADCCAEKRGYEEDEEEITFRQDTETGEITDPREDEPEPEGAEDLWEDHIRNPDEPEPDEG